MLSLLLSCLLYGIAAFNLTKIPAYVLLAIPKEGLESSAALRAFGYRGRKLQSSPLLFLAPHTLMGSALLALHGAYLDGSAGTVAIPQFDRVFFGLCALFALHLWPERSGIPNRIAKLPLNELAVGTVFAGCAAWWAGHADIGRWVCFAPLILAPVLEIFGIAKSLVLFAKAGGRFDPPEGHKPIRPNPHGYPHFRCPMRN